MHIAWLRSRFHVYGREYKRTKASMTLRVPLFAKLGVIASFAFRVGGRNTLITVKSALRATVTTEVARRSGESPCRCITDYGGVHITDLVQTCISVLINIFNSDMHSTKKSETEKGLLLPQLNPTFSTGVLGISVILANRGHSCIFNERKTILQSQMSCTFTTSARGSALENCLWMAVSKPMWTFCPLDSYTVGHVLDVWSNVPGFRQIFGKCDCIASKLLPLLHCRHSKIEESSPKGVQQRTLGFWPRFATWYFVIISSVILQTGWVLINLRARKLRKASYKPCFPI